MAGDLIFVTTGNGVDEGHINTPSPLAPSFIALHKNGELIWENALPGEKILHGSWSNPAYGVIGGVPQVVFPGGDGIVARTWLVEPATPGTVDSAIMCHGAALAQSFSCFLLIRAPSATSPARYIASALPLS